jgi:molybdopterin synthase sulfur carrier subunit
MNILYFASLKESIGIPKEHINFEHNITVGELKSWLINKYGDKNFPGNILCAVNQEIANNEITINDGDEVAFYPPVTGG